jgi:tRNA(fMet)-specific endonuclease VapC
MSRVLLDTSAYSALFRNHQGVKLALQECGDIILSPIVLGEILSGFLGGARLQANELELADFLSSDRVSVLPIDEETSRRYAVILHGLRRSGTPINSNDLWIAASAMQHGLTVLTTDKDFERVPQIITMCFDPKG